MHWDVEILPEIWTGLLCWSLGAARRSLRTFPMTQGRGSPTSVDLVQEHHLPERMTGLSLETSSSNAGIRAPVSGKRVGSREATSLHSTHAPYAYKVFMAKIFQSSIAHTFASEIRTFKISSVSSTDLIITTAIDSFGNISPGYQELNCPCFEEGSGTEKSLVNIPTRCPDLRKI